MAVRIDYYGVSDIGNSARKIKTNLLLLIYLRISLFPTLLFTKDRVTKSYNRFMEKYLLLLMEWEELLRGSKQVQLL